MHDADWRTRAACRDTDSDLFYGPDEEEPRRAMYARVRAAKAVCARCPVQAECLAYALAANEDHGVWGGTTAPTRRRLRSARGAKAA